MLCSKVEYENKEYAFVKCGKVKLGFHPSDEKNSQGTSGSVSYWDIGSLEETVSALEKRGANLYRGPIVTDFGDKIAMMIDPFGNLFGLNESTKNRR